jgi:hypothetical protein
MALKQANVSGPMIKGLQVFVSKIGTKTWAAPCEPLRQNRVHGELIFSGPDALMLLEAVLIRKSW